MKANTKSLNTPTKILRFLSMITNQFNNDEISAHKAKTLGYLCSTMNKIIESSDLEKRIEDLEKLAKEKY